MSQITDQSPDATTPTFTIVIPAYNADRWLREAVDSVLYQTIGQEDIQLILVNDGSTDRTAAIIDEYAGSDPNVVLAIHQPNGGVSAAMNVGIEHAAGEYIGFLGADDYLSTRTLELVADFYEEHGSEVDLVSIPLEMFGTKKGPHPGNGERFDSTRVIDCTSEWNKVHIAGGGAFIRRAALDEYGIRFDPELFIGEDLVFNTRVIMRRLRYGVVADARYYNRRHPTGVSLVTSASLTSGFYDHIVEHMHFALVDEALGLYGQVPLYVQSAICYDLRGRVKDQGAAKQETALIDSYRKRISDLLAHIAPEVILDMNLWREEKAFLLSLKSGDDALQTMPRRGATFLANGEPFYSFGTRPSGVNRPVECRMHFFEVDGDQLTITGHFTGLPFTSARPAFVVNGVLHETQDGPNPVPQRQSMGRPVPPPGFSFSFTTAIENNQTIEPVIILAADEDNGELVCKVPWLPGPFTWFCGGSGTRFYRHDTDWEFFGVSRTALRIKRPGALGTIKRELAFFTKAKLKGAPWSALRLRAYGLTHRRIRRLLGSRPTWLIQDRKLEAGDNGEALFRYANASRQDGPRVALSLSRDSAAYGDLRRVGPIVEPDSDQFARAYVRSSWMASSAGDALVINPLPKIMRIINDLRPRRFAFLQHGVTLHDVSGWLNRIDKGFELFVTSAEAEREAIATPSYGYTDEHVCLTGMPRFDRLVSNPAGVIVVAPTWRKWLASPIDTKTLRRKPFPAFNQSLYFRFWDTLIHHRRVTEALQESGMRIALALHPCHEAEASAFAETDTVTVLDYPHDYSNLFEIGNVLVTDYSSVAFDFGYLRKPVLYAQPDAEQYLGGAHTGRESYFSYERDGFGPIASSLGEAVDALVALIESKGELPELYRSRADEFFAFDDRGSSQRVYDSMLERFSD
ncbi:hypothetical protein BW730_16025 [Tessaracoccus aquimaris]|uniref:Glycosyltransferase 2-like domain-containing protein n=1 Tax=Tessaracoccus aquimaris TaxID=1332264 RepID=A0A1Q2CRP1_9ACTN|nr:CDP-glycerol glycerophosphotransferase family protein [Tessaracoccus aquimaris]AQP48786.1 hypothetical protein BW730_16025 [Tessaracoccus aquimaris]